MIIIILSFCDRFVITTLKQSDLQCIVEKRLLVEEMICKRKIIVFYVGNNNIHVYRYIIKTSLL